MESEIIKNSNVKVSPWRVSLKCIKFKQMQGQYRIKYVIDIIVKLRVGYVKFSLISARNTVSTVRYFGSAIFRVSAHKA